MEATPAPTLPPTDTSAPAPAPRSLSTKQQLVANKLVRGWRRFYSLFKAAEKKVDAARELVTKFALDAGVEQLVVDDDTLKLQTRDDVSWKDLAEALLSKDAIAAAKPLYTKTSKPFFKALASWSSK